MEPTKDLQNNSKPNRNRENYHTLSLYSTITTKEINIASKN